MTNKKTGSIRSYLIGYIISILLTLAAFWFYSLYQENLFVSQEFATAFLLSLATLQLFVQLIFFLHLGHEKSPRWNLLFFISTVSIILVVILGSLWIMFHLNYNMMPHETSEYLIWKEGIRK